MSWSLHDPHEKPPPSPTKLWAVVFLITMGTIMLGLFAALAWSQAQP